MSMVLGSTCQSKKGFKIAIATISVSFRKDFWVCIGKAGHSGTRSSRDVVIETNVRELSATE